MGCEILLNNVQSKGKKDGVLRRSARIRKKRRESLDKKKEKRKEKNNAFAKITLG